MRALFSGWGAIGRKAEAALQHSEERTSNTAWEAVPAAEVSSFALTSPCQLRLALLEDEPNSAFFRSLMLSESRGHSHEKECSAQSVVFIRLMSVAAVCGLPVLPVVRDVFSFSFFRETCCNCCCFAANAAAMLLRR
jgi:hypothetical protein